MIVVSDTSPITSLITIRRITLLHEVIHTVLIPPAVERELLAFHDELPWFIRVEPALDVATLQRLGHCSTKAKRKPLRSQNSNGLSGC